VCLIDVPFAMGDDRHEASEGGRRLLDGGGRELFARRATACRDLRVARDVGRAAELRERLLLDRVRVREVLRQLLVQVGHGCSTTFT